MIEAYAPTGKAQRHTPVWEWQRVLSQRHEGGLHILVLRGSAGVVTYKTNRAKLRFSRRLQR